MIVSTQKFNISTCPNGHRVDTKSSFRRLKKKQARTGSSSLAIHGVLSCFHCCVAAVRLNMIHLDDCSMFLCGTS